MSRFVEDIRRAVARGDLPRHFRPDDVRGACPGWADHVYGVFLPKHSFTATITSALATPLDQADAIRPGQVLFLTRQ